MEEKFKGMIAAFVAAILWGLLIPTIRYLTLQGVSPILIAIVRLWTGSITLLILVLFIKNKINFTIENKKWFFIVALIGISLNFILFQTGIKYTSANSAVLLGYTVPIWVLILMLFFFREKINLLKVLAVVLSFTGVVLIVIGDSGLEALRGRSLIGDFLIIFSAITFAFFVIGSSEFLNMNKLNIIDRIEILGKIFLTSAIVLSPLLFFVSYKINLLQFSIIAVLGIVQTTLAFSLWYYALAKISTITSSLAFNLVIVTTFIFSWFLLKESINAYMAIGGLLIIIAIFLSENIKLIFKKH